MLCKLTLEQICTMTESPLFDRKSARIDAKTLAIHLIAFANADGGVIAVGVEDDGTITGIDGYQEHINELLRVPFDYCKPSVQIETELLACTNRDGEPDYILLIEVLQSNELHANQADDVFFRVGDKSKKLNFDERLQLMYAKGTRYFEDTPVPDAAMEDIDLDFVREYTQKLGYRKSPEEYVTEALDPRGYEVFPIASPLPYEKSRHFLWRFFTRLPRSGHVAIFDRTWYGRVMVERIEGFCSENDWKRAYNEINEFEKELYDWGAVIIKFWIQIDKDTQLERFTLRQNTPEKQWKITDEDWRNREKWDQYETAVNEMLQKTSTTYAPWHIIESVDKKYARLKTLEIIVDAIEKAIS